MVNAELLSSLLSKEVIPLVIIMSMVQTGHNEEVVRSFIGSGTH
jgi:hypothetical protein